MLKVNQLTGFGAGAAAAGSPVAVEYIGENGDSSGGVSTYTFTSEPIGAAASERKIIIGVTYLRAATVSISTATASGLNAIIHTDSGTTATNSIGAAFLSVNIPAGTTATIVINFTGTVDVCAISVWKLTGDYGEFPEYATSYNNSASANIARNLIIPEEGIQLCVGGTESASTGVSWTNATEEHDVNYGTLDTSGTTDTGLVANSDRNVTMTPSSSYDNALASLTLAGVNTTTGTYSTLTFESTGTDGTNRTAPVDVTFSSQGIGTASANRIVLVQAMKTSTGNCNVSGVNVGGIEGYKVAGTGGLRNSSWGTDKVFDLWAAHVPTGTTADIVIRGAGTTGTDSRNGVFVYSLYPDASDARVVEVDINWVNDVTDNPANASVFTTANSFVTAMAHRYQSTDFAWAVLTEDAQVSYDASNLYGCASKDGDGTTFNVSMTATGGLTNIVELVAIAAELQSGSPSPSSLLEAMEEDGALAIYRLNETSGTTAAEFLGNYGSATYEGLIHLTLGQTDLLGGSSACVYMDGTSGTSGPRIDGGVKNFDAFASNSFECVVKLSSLTSTMVFTQDGANGNGQAIGAYYNGSTLYLRAAMCSSSTLYSADYDISAITTSDVLHVIGSFDKGNEIRLYLNGSRVATNSTSIPLTSNGTNGFVIGACHDGSNFGSALTATSVTDQQMNGYIQDVAIYGWPIDDATALRHAQAAGLA